jgi:uncharacterized protein YndB with AHSA1/START domain
VTYSTESAVHVRAPRHRVYRALLDPEAIAVWRVPPDMASHVHEFDAREGGLFRISLTYDDPDVAGKSGGRTDTFHGRFVRLVPDARVVEELEFETTDDALRGSMTITTTLRAAVGGTDVVMVHQGVPDAVPAADNEAGTRIALDQLARLVESTAGDPR